MERAFQTAEGLAKFDRMAEAGVAEVVYRGEDGAVAIYHILREPGEESALPPVPGWPDWASGVTGSGPP
jgi:hypothetical protein